MLAQGRKRLYWELSKVSQSGVTGATGAAITVADPQVDEIAMAAVLAIDPEPDALFGVDLTYDRNGIPNPTEINIGRFFTTHLFFTELGVNMPYVFVKLACDEPVPEIPQKLNPAAPGMVWIRGMDFEPVLVPMSDIEAQRDRARAAEKEAARMRVLLTGATGFLGRRVAELLVAGGHDVVSIGRSAAGRIRTARTSLHQGRPHRSRQTSVTPPAKRVRSIRSFTLPRWSRRTPRQDEAATAFAVNVMGTVHLFGAFGRAGQANIVASTAEVYGLPEGHDPLREDTELRPLSWYGASKVATEIFCRTLEHRDEMHIAILRFTVLYGSGDTIQRAIPNFVRSAVRGESIRHLRRRGVTRLSARR